MIHTSRLPSRRPPTVGELIERLQLYPSTHLVVGVDRDRQAVLAPSLGERNVFLGLTTGNYYLAKVDANEPTKAVKAVAL